MNRRHFVRSTLATSATLVTGSAVAATLTTPSTTPANTPSMDNARAKQQWYELRFYTFADETQRKLTSDYLEHALIPALNRAGLSNIGVFTELPQPPAAPAATQPAPASPAANTPATNIPAASAPSGLRTILLIPFDTIETFTTLGEKLSHDNVYPTAAAPYLDAPATAPAYQRIESNLLKAFAHMPAMEVPEKKTRLFELRRYESPSEAAGQKKIEMFNDAGEIDIFKKIGARPVFFGEALIGEYRPNLTYMLTFDDMTDHDARWKAFGSDPDWKTISKKTEYSDARLISKITRTFLAPAPYSQI